MEVGVVVGVCGSQEGLEGELGVGREARHLSAPALVPLADKLPQFTHCLQGVHIFLQSILGLH